MAIKILSRLETLGQKAAALKAAAEKALAENKSTFALLPISNLLSDDGYLSELAARGYAVEAPDERI